MFLVLCLAMFAGSFVAGYAPILLARSVSKEVQRGVSVFGAGLLLGTALMVILPEGIGAEQQQGAQIGIPVACGFLFMALIEHAVHLSSETDEEDTRQSDGHAQQHVVSLGLVIHAAVDGIVFGTVAAESVLVQSSSMEMLVFLAIFLHKAPAAFNLTLHLLHKNTPHRQVVRHLLSFAASSPLCALVTFAVVHLWTVELNVAALLLFSAGTFLFVATMHILPELGQLRLSELLLLCAGTLLPALHSDHAH